MRQQSLILPPTLGQYRQAIAKWWNSPIGTVAPVLRLVGSDLADRSALLDSFVAEIARANDQLADSQEIEWWDLRPDGLRAAVDDPAGSLRALLDGMASGILRAREQFGGMGVARADRVVVVSTGKNGELKGNGWADLSALLARIIGDPGLADRAGTRLVVAGDSSKSAGLAGDAEIVDMPYMQRRTALVDRIDAWARDPRQEPVLTVRGHPGSGKTELLAEAVRRFSQPSADSLGSGQSPVVRLGYHLLRGSGDARFDVELLVEGVAGVLAEEGFMLGGRTKPEIYSTATAETVSEHGTVIGTAIGNLHINRSLLSRRPAATAAAPGERRGTPASDDCLGDRCYQ